MIDGNSLGRYIAGQIAVLVLIALVAGAALALGGWFGISWLLSHVSISFQ